jgi:hypothetical protein
VTFIDEETSQIVGVDVEAGHRAMLRRPFLVDSRQPAQRLRDHMRIAPADAAVHRDRASCSRSVGVGRASSWSVIRSTVTKGARPARQGDLSGWRSRTLAVLS